MVNSTQRGHPEMCLLQVQPSLAANVCICCGMRSVPSGVCHPIAFLLCPREACHHADQCMKQLVPASTSAATRMAMRQA